ncbi:MAG: STAS domain-containing protein [Armatimonadota bacterium]
MSAGTEDSFEMRLKNAEGIPVLCLGGKVSATSLRAVRFTLEKLASAGHYNVVLNLEKAQAANWSFLTGLADAVRKFREHHGAVDIVATQERIQSLLRVEQVAKLFRLSRSEGQAISRIKRLPRDPESVSGTDARLQ